LIAAPDLKSLEGAVAKRVVTRLEVSDLNRLGTNSEQDQHMRRAIEAYVTRAATAPIVLAISNTGSSGIRNLYVEMDVIAPTDILVSDKEPRDPRSRGAWSQETITFLWHDVAKGLPTTTWEDLDVGWDSSPDLSPLVVHGPC
jgi:hypothetical protein